MAALQFENLTGRSYAGRLLFGAHTGSALPASYQELGNSENLSFSQEGADSPEVLSNDVGTNRQVLDSRNLPGTLRIALTQNTFSTEVFNMLFLGSETTLSQSSGTGVATTPTLVRNQWVYSGFREISSVALTGCVLDTDFKVWAEPGLIMSISATGDGAKTGTLNHAAITGGSNIAMGTNATGIRGSLKFVGKDMGKGSNRVEILINDVLLYIDGEYSLVTDDGAFTSASVSGSMRMPSFDTKLGTYIEY